MIPVVSCFPSSVSIFLKMRFFVSNSFKTTVAIHMEHKDVGAIIKFCYPNRNSMNFAFQFAFH